MNPELLHQLTNEARDRDREYTTLMELSRRPCLSEDEVIRQTAALTRLIQIRAEIAARQGQTELVIFQKSGARAVARLHGVPQMLRDWARKKGFEVSVDGNQNLSIAWNL